MVIDHRKMRNEMDRNDALFDVWNKRGLVCVVSEWEPMKKFTGKPIECVRRHKEICKWIDQVEQEAEHSGIICIRQRLGNPIASRTRRKVRFEDQVELERKDSEVGREMIKGKGVIMKKGKERKEMQIRWDSNSNELNEIIKQDLGEKVLEEIQLVKAIKKGLAGIWEKKIGEASIRYRMRKITTK